MKLITEEIEQVEVIVEERNGSKSMFIEGVFLQGDIQNRNGRMYPMDTLRREVCAIGQHGGTLSNGRQYEGVMNAMERYKFHTKANNWDYPMEYQQQNGQLYIEI